MAHSETKIFQNFSKEWIYFEARKIVSIGFKKYIYPGKNFPPKCYDLNIFAKENKIVLKIF